MFDKLVGMSPPPPFEVYTALNPTLDQRTPYEVSLTDTQDTYYNARFGSAGFLTSKLQCCYSQACTNALNTNALS
jgi:hypothetical protein